MTTAATTGFAIEKVDIGGGNHLFIDGNQKITAGNATFEDPAANAFSLPQVVTCPMRTPTCEKACYVHNLETHQGWLHECYKHNLATVREIIETPNWVPRANSAATLGRWIAENCPGGFRWHVSGDLFGEIYTEWVARVVRSSAVASPPEHRPRHWIYTRSFNLIPLLIDHLSHARDCMTINLSADADNYWLARRVADKHGLRVCYLTVDGTVPDDLKEGDVIFPDYGLRGIGKRPHAWRDGSEWWQSLTGDQRKMVCPTDAYGKTDAVRCGPCDRCIK